MTIGTPNSPMKGGIEAGSPSWSAVTIRRRKAPCRVQDESDYDGAESPQRASCQHRLSCCVGIEFETTLGLPTRAGGWNAIHNYRAEAHATGVDAYLYFYSLISADITRLISTNIETGKEPLKGPANTFLNAASYPPAEQQTH